MPDLANLTELAAQQPMLLRALIGAAGAVLLFFGARVYRPALVLAGFGAGAAGTVAAFLAAAEWVPAFAEPTTLIVGGLLGGGLLCVLTLSVHRLGLVGVGALVGATATVSAAGLLSASPAWWVPLAGALGGAALMPWVFPVLLKIATPAVGAVLVGWAAGYPDHPALLLGLWVLGSAVQLASGGKRRREEDEDE
jgi:hypothetical protein